MSCVRAFELRENKHGVVAIKPQSIRSVRRRKEMNCKLHAPVFLASDGSVTSTIEQDPRWGPRRPAPPKPGIHSAISHHTDSYSVYYTCTTTILYFGICC
jgi:hypothetical protein